MLVGRSHPIFRVRVNQILRGKPAEILVKLKREGYFRTTSQAINEAVLLLGERYAEKIVRLGTLEVEEHTRTV